MSNPNFRCGDLYRDLEYEFIWRVVDPKNDAKVLWLDPSTRVQLSSEYTNAYMVANSKYLGNINEQLTELAKELLKL